MTIDLIFKHKMKIDLLLPELRRMIFLKDHSKNIKKINLIREFQWCVQWLLI